jgi:hypothetical protein
MLNPDKTEDLYKIMVTRTDFNNFQLQRFNYRQTIEDLKQENIIDFIMDVKMKKLEPEYKSEKIVPEEENKGVLRKIVGNSFISEIYEKPNESFAVLFVDSKD